MSLFDRKKELLSLALHIEKTEGSNGPKYIAERIGSAARESDVEQIDFWKEVAVEYQALLVAVKRH